MIARDLVSAVIEARNIKREGPHGPAHWARVAENGRRLAGVTGADLDVVLLFALFHDARRENDGRDPGHGRRGAGLAARMRGKHFRLEGRRFDLLYYACCHHTDGLTEGDVTVQTCWDADRLDLGRVNIAPDPDRLCTAAARDPELSRWAERRSRSGARPDFLDAEWLDPPGAGEETTDE